MVDYVKEVLEECQCTRDEIATARCEQLEKIQNRAAQKAIVLIEKIGEPRKVGDEVYDYAGDVEKLLTFIEMTEKLCRMKQSTAVGFVTLPGGTVVSDELPPLSTQLAKLYRECCSPARVSYG